MAAFWMCELSPTEIASTDSFKRNRLTCQEALSSDRARSVGHIRAFRQTLQVLVVDDEQDTADAFGRLIYRWGHAARLAYGGAAALRIAAVQHPDVVLLDLAMPFQDGFLVARQLRRDFSNYECFIIAIAGEANEQQRERCADAGIDVVLIKPVEAAVLETLLMLESERVKRSASTSNPAIEASSPALRHDEFPKHVLDGGMQPRAIA